jgi:hypothetical protein
MAVCGVRVFLGKWQFVCAQQSLSVCVLQECFLSGGDWPVQQLRELCLPGVLCGSECAAHMQLLLLYCS